MSTTSRRTIVGGAFLIALLHGISVIAAPTPSLSVEAFGKVPAIADVELNAAGNLLAWSDSSGGEPMVVIFDLNTRTQKRKMGVGSNATLRGLDWADDETLLIHLSVTDTAGAGIGSVQYEMYRTLAVDAAGGPTRILLLADQARASVATSADLLALHTSKPKTVIMATWDYSAAKKGREIDSRLIGGRKDAGWLFNLFEVDTRSGKGKLIDHGSYLTYEWVIDKDGQSAARSEWDAEQGAYRVLAKDGGGWKEIHRQEDGEVLQLYSLTADGSAIVALGANGHARAKLWAIPLDGSGAKVLLEDENYDIEAVVRDGYSWAPLGAWIGGAEPHVRWMDATAEARHKALSRTFAGRGVSIYGRSADGSRVLARVGSHSAPVVYYLVDFSKGTADIVGDDYPALEKAPLGEVRTISYKARDGYAVPAYVTIPPGEKPENLPLVVMPHGGPESRDEQQFDPFAQFIASRGYAVLQPQFRGSTGFGEAHRKAGYRQWGGLMQDDVTDGVKALIEQGLADPRRICIVGASYGGYVALAGAAFTPDLYRCAASINGISDLPAMLGHVAKRWGKESNSLAYWSGHIGSGHDPKVIDKSPAGAARKIRSPILLIHGAEDTVVPITQADAMARALADLGKPHTLVKLPGEDHWLSQSETRVRVLRELETFLAAHLGTTSGE
jgi:dipeptidyl aminopeptidase/acylaminoacyl peptidase